ncbi:hypothetical protein KY328_02085 [Candidatus Woesearchaeota archaeon]|nr:hypothetical protein [Candidatus Woesearchaeota archaeon]
MQFKDFNVDTTGYPKVMLCWQGDESEAIEDVVLGELMDNSLYGYICASDNYINVKPLPDAAPRGIKDGLKYGDIVINDEGDQRKVLGVCDEAIFLSHINGFSIAAGSVYSIQELINMGYTLKQPKSELKIVELTIQDISDGKGKGIDPKLIRIKE